MDFCSSDCARTGAATVAPWGTVVWAVPEFQPEVLVSAFRAYAARRPALAWSSRIEAVLGSMPRADAMVSGVSPSTSTHQSTSTQFRHVASGEEEPSIVGGIKMDARTTTPGEAPGIVRSVRDAGVKKRDRLLEQDIAVPRPGCIRHLTGPGPLIQQDSTNRPLQLDRRQPHHQRSPVDTETSGLHVDHVSGSTPGT